MSLQAKVVASAEIVDDLFGEMVDIDDDMVYAEGLDFLYHATEHGLTAYFGKRFGVEVSEGFEPCAESGSKNHCFHIDDCSVFDVEVLFDVLFAVYEFDFDVEFAVDVFGHVLGAVDRAMLTSCAAEADHEVGKSALFVACDRGVDKSIAVVKENANLSVILKKLNDLTVETCERFVAFVFAGVVDRAAVEYISATVARWVVGDAFFVGKAHNFDGQ